MFKKMGIRGFVAVLPIFILMFAIFSVPSAMGLSDLSVYFDDLSGFNGASYSPPVTIDFDDIAPGTDITGSTIMGVTFEQGLSIVSAPLLVVEAIDTHSLPGYDPPAGDDNRLFATSGANVLSPGGEDLAPGPNDALENDDMILSFANPVLAVGFDVLFQSLDPGSSTFVKVLDAEDHVLFFEEIPMAGEYTGGSVFVGFVSDSSDIAQIVIDDRDGDEIFPDNNIGLDTIRLRVSEPTAPSAPQNLAAIVGDGFVKLTWNAPSDDGGAPITGYQIWRGKSPGNEALYAVAGTELLFEDTGVANGQTYYYKVIAVNAMGPGDDSTGVSAIAVRTGDDTLLYIGIGAIAAIVIVAVAFFAIRGRKKR